MEQHHKLVAALTCGTVALTAYHLLLRHNAYQSDWHVSGDGSLLRGAGSFVRALRLHKKPRRRSPTATYDWAQSLEEVLIEVLVPAHTTTQDVSIKFGSGSLMVTVGEQPVINGQLSGQVQPGESSWKLGGKGSHRILSITLCKCPPVGTEAQFSVWDSLLTPVDDRQQACDQKAQHLQQQQASNAAAAAMPADVGASAVSRL